MIELTGVTKRYGRRGAGTEAVRDITLSIPAGAVWAVVGPNGAGKSTLLSLILGFLRTSDGAVRIGGEKPREYLRGHGAAYLPERFRLPGEWRVADAVRLLGRMDGVAAGDIERVRRDFGLEPHLDKRVRELSRGLLQRLGLAQALLAPRMLVVLDEPTEGLDPLWRIRLRDIVAALREAGRTVVMASHDLTEVERMADRAVLLEAGAVRNVLDTRGVPSTAIYRITFDTPFDDVLTVFSTAARQDEHSWIVTVGDAHELTQRIGAVIALGGVIRSIEPVRHALEDRVRDVLEGNA